MAVTKSQMRMLQRRRMSDTDRLAQQYKRNVEALTGEYESAFGQFQQKRNEAMAPFEAEFAKYKTEAFPAYEQQMAGYKQRLDEFQKQLQFVEANPKERFDFRNNNFVSAAGEALPISNPATTTSGQLEAMGYEPIIEWRGRYGYLVGVNRERQVPTFTEKAPEAPKAPAAPQAAEFDDAPFEQRRAALETDFKREVGERRAGRMSAVSRRSARPMLQRS